MKITTTGPVFALAMMISAATAMASDTLSGDEIRSTVSDHTVSGAMLETGPYAEFYQADGTILGDGYTGSWSVKGDTMCFAYGGEAAGCWHVGMEDGSLRWIQDGEVLGDGVATPGNVNGF